MLEVVPVNEAAEKIKAAFAQNNKKSETVPLSEAVGRTAAQNIVSRENVPLFSRSVMDGYALKAKDTFGAGDSIPCMLNIAGEILMGQEASISIGNGQCVKISTGGMLPEGADAVIPVELTEEDIGDICLVYKAVSPFENVTAKGDDVAEDQVVIKKGTVLTSAHIGVLAAMGQEKVCVAKKPLIGIISTGDELTDITEKSAPGKIRDVNTYLLSALTEKYGGIAKKYGIIRDEYEALLSALKTASEECDSVLISGGSSAGTRDMTARAISELGEVFIHGLAMKPGKPTIIGKIGGKAVFGLPGHPAACYFVTEILVKQLLHLLLGAESKENYAICKISENISSNHGREEMLCVRTENGIAFPLRGKSGIISLLSQADGYIKIDRDCEGLQKNETVKVYAL